MRLTSPPLRHSFSLSATKQAGATECNIQPPEGGQDVYDKEVDFLREDHLHVQYVAVEAALGPFTPNIRKAYTTIAFLAKTSGDPPLITAVI